MLRPGSQVLFSTSWKPACELSKLAQIKSERRKVTSAVHKATLRLLRATISGSPRMKKMNAAPTRGRKVTRERSGQSPIGSASQHEQIPGDEAGDPDQHGEGVVVEVAGLQPHGAPGRGQRAGRDA